MRNNIFREKIILSRIKSKLITNMFCTFQDFSKLYLVLELMSGGDLRFHLNHFQGHFPENMIKFIIINISLCLALIQENDIVHRDIKPENFLFDDKGYLHLTDFNSAVYRKEENDKNDFMIKSIPNPSYDDINLINIEKDLVGTISYIAPENILATQNYISFSEDYYAFGVICYELIFKRKPFLEKTRFLLGKEMLKNNINYNINFNYSEKLIDLVKNLLAINPKDRLGTFGGFFDIQKSDYLGNFNWEKFLDREYNSPFLEVINDYKKYYLKSDKDDIELFDYVNSGKKTFNLNEKEKMELHKIEGNPIFLDSFNGYEYIYFDHTDLISVVKLLPDTPKFKDIKKRKIKKSNSNKDIYTRHYFMNKDSYFEKHKNNKSIVYLPIIKKERKIVFPKIDPKIVSNAYKYKILKYQKYLNKIKDDNKKERERTNKSEHKKDNIENKKPIPLIINNYCQPKGINNLNSLPYYPYNSDHIKNNIFFFPYLKNCTNNRYSSLSSSQTYEELFGKLGKKTNKFRKETFNNNLKEEKRKTKTEKNKYSENIKYYKEKEKKSNNDKSKDNIDDNSSDEKSSSSYDSYDRSSDKSKDS